MTAGRETSSETRMTSMTKSSPHAKASYGYTTYYKSKGQHTKKAVEKNPGKKRVVVVQIRLIHDA